MAVRSDLLASRQARLFALRALAALRWPTAPLRAEPSFIIIGAQKSATSSLYGRLVDLPGVEPALRKEVHFFGKDRVYRLGLGYYRAHFPLRRRLRRPDGSSSVTGEATPTYLMSSVAARRIAHALPDCRFVVVLRDPTERAVSHYHHRRRAGKEQRDIDRALLESLAAAERMSADPNEDDGAQDSYVGWGLYARYLSVWYDLVGADRMMVVGMDAIVDDTTTTLSQIAEFIGVGSETTATELPHLNQGGGADGPSPDVEAEIRSFFEGPDHDLRELLRDRQPDRPLPGWLRTTGHRPSGAAR